MSVPASGGTLPNTPGPAVAAHPDDRSGHLPSRSPDKPSDSPTPMVDAAEDDEQRDVREAWFEVERHLAKQQAGGFASYLDLAKDIVRRVKELERELAEELEKKREVFIALHDRALKAEADLANHAADLSARSATAPRWIPLEERKPAPGQKVLRFNHPILVPDGIDVGEVICADGKPWALPGTTHWMQLPSAPVDSGGAK